MNAFGELLKIRFVGPFLWVDLAAESSSREGFCGLGVRGKGHLSRVVEELVTELLCEREAIPQSAHHQASNCPNSITCEPDRNDADD